jgi:hypothetical protein
MSSLTLQESINRLQSNEERLDQFVNDGNGSGSFTTAGGVVVPSLPAVAARAAELRNDLAEDDGAGQVGFKQCGTGAAARTVESKLRETVSVRDFGAVGDGVTDDTAAIQAALNAGSLGKSHSVLIPAGCVFGITNGLVIKANTTIYFEGWIKCLSYGMHDTALIPENGGNNIRIVNPQIDLNNQAGMSGFIIRTGAHNVSVDGGVIKNATHDKGGVQGGRGFIVESVATVLPGRNVTVRGVKIDNCYMGFAYQAGEDMRRQSVIISDIAVYNCDVVYWIVGNTAGYPHDPDEMSAIISGVSAYNCGKQGQYTNGGGAFVADRACNIVMRDIMLVNDSSYGSIPSVWHGNGARLQLDITYLGDCENFWNFQPYKEADAPPATENTIEDSVLRGVQHGACTDIATVGNSADAYAEKVHLTGWHAYVSSGSVVTANLRQDDVWFDVYEKANNARVIGSGDKIAAFTFAQTAGKVARYGSTVFGTDPRDSYAPTALFSDSESGYNGGIEIRSFAPSIKFRDISGSGVSGAMRVDAGVIRFALDETPATPAWSEQLLLDKFSLRPAADNARACGNASLRWSVVYAGTGTINTSDEREKQQIRDLSAAERAVAVRLKSLIRAFKFNDAVAAKGESARTHLGVIAQDVKAAFEAEGLVAEDYAILCYDEWGEQPETVDEDGNVTQEYRPAGNRYGVRYEELLAFIIAAL